MLPVFVWVALLAAHTHPEPPKVVGPIVLSGTENAVITTTADTGFKWERVNTSSGLRIRVTSGNTSLEATRLKIRVPMNNGEVWVTTIQVSADGKTIDYHKEEEPAKKP